MTGPTQKRQIEAGGGGRRLQPAALKLLPEDTYRASFRKWIAQHPKKLWQTDEYWQQWKPLLKATFDI